MLSESYEASFEDARGLTSTRIHNDGDTLRLTLRGIDFIGDDFDALVPVPDQLERALTLFMLAGDALCACRLEWTMPLAVEILGEVHRGALHAALVLGDPRPNGGIDSETLTLTLTTPTETVSSSGRSGWFEDELLELAAALSERARIRSCLTCAHSDYHPAGHGLFGGLACFRDVEDDYSRVVDKPGIFAIWDRRTEFVQETFLCPQYRLRRPGAGYRG